MKKLLLAASALTLFAVPAQAQLLGGGLGGGLGGTLGGSATGTVGGTLDSVRGTTDSVRSSTRGSTRGDARTRGSQNVDRRSGSVAVDRSADAAIAGDASQMLDNSVAPLGANAQSSGSASGQGVVVLLLMIEVPTASAV
ncbi:hypothetical protein J4558_11850 [Leptolyngbya sp. 15MV]|nr:hypothetical protein J4558_11850 [Leptolyngbya sp. 15MV]